MNNREIENWKKVKKALEESGKKDCFYYVRACMILQGKPDPFIQKN